MADSTGFQHIRVVPADEEEIVIQAGAVRDGGEAPAPEPALAAEVAPAPVLAAESEPAVESEPAPMPAPAPDADAKAEAQLENAEAGVHNLSWALHSAIAEERAENPRGPREGYRETTLEDLQSAPMPKMQKIILIVLLALVVVFGVYFALRFGAHLF